MCVHVLWLVHTWLQVLEDDLRFHKQWQPLLADAISTLRAMRKPPHTAATSTTTTTTTAEAQDEKGSSGGADGKNGGAVPEEVAGGGGGGASWWSGLFYLDAMDTTGWDLSKKGLIVAEQCVYADAYLLSRSAARALLRSREDEPEHHGFRDHEHLMSDYQDEKDAVGTSYTVLPRLALQRWDESDIQTGSRIAAFDAFYKNVYHKTYKEALYDD